MSTDPHPLEGAPELGTVIAEKYRVVGVVGSGGMGCLVKAEHLLLKKAVAIKFVLANRSGAARRRLFREARAAQALSSEHVVRVFDLGVHQEAPYIVMELLEGTDLAERVDAEGAFQPAEAVDCLLEACVAVAEAHALGIIHRDIKPANLFSTRTKTQELVKVLDFGISKVPEVAGDDDCEKTAEDAVLGTPYYTSPEQLRNPTKIDGRADVWALGVTLFHLLSGEHPFPGESTREVMASIFTDDPLDLRDLRPELPEELCRVVDATLAKRPEQRIASVEALVQELLPFASKRGRLAAERVGAMDRPAPLPAPVPRTRQVPMSTTDEGLSSTLPATEASTDTKRSIVVAKTPVKGFVLAGVLALVVVGGWVMSTPDATPLRVGVLAGSVPQSVVDAAQSASAPLPEASTQAAPPADPLVASASASVSVARAPTPRGKSPPPAPSATPSASAPAPRSDIDGVPIVE
jgi:serine/threonine-protein kinase